MLMAISHSTELSSASVSFDLENRAMAERKKAIDELGQRVNHMKIVKCIAWVLFAYAGYAAYQVFAIQAPFMDAYICNQVGGSWSCNTSATLNRVTPETYAGYMLPFVVAWLGVAGMMLFGAFRSKKMVYFAFAAAVMLVIVFQYYVPTLHLKPQFDAEQVQKQAQTGAPASTVPSSAPASRVPSNCPAPTKTINFHIAPGETVAPFSMCGDDILSDDRFDSTPSTPIVMRIYVDTPTRENALAQLLLVDGNWWVSFFSTDDSPSSDIYTYRAYVASNPLGDEPLFVDRSDYDKYPAMQRVIQSARQAGIAITVEQLPKADSKRATK
jgi:hypothetical protein